MDLVKARRAIEEVAKSKGMSVESVINEIDLAITEAMQDPDPQVQERWTHIPRSGSKPTAVEFVAYMREKMNID